MENDTPEEEQNNQRKKRCALNFLEMGLKEGDTLVYLHDNKYTCTIASARRVIFESKETSLTALTQKLMDCKYAPQPTGHWTYEGRNLADLYEEWQERLANESDEETEVTPKSWTD